MNPAPPKSLQFRWLAGYALRRWPGFLVVLATMLAGIAMDVLKPLPMKVLIDYVLLGKPMPETMRRIAALLPGGGSRDELLAWSVAGTVVLFLLGWGLGVVNAYARIGFGQRMVYDLAADLFAHLQGLSLGFHSRRRLGDSIRRVTTDSGCVSTIIQDALLPVLSSIFTLVAMFGLMWPLSPRLTLLSLVVIPFMVVAFRRYAGPMLERSYEQQEAEGRLYDVIEETLTAIPAVQAFGREDAADTRFAAGTDENMRAVLASTDSQLRFKIWINFITAAGTAGILWLGAREVMAGTITIGTIWVFLAYLASLYAPLNALMYTSSAIQSAAASARRVREILDTRREVEDMPGARALPAVQGRVELENVVFGYEAGRPFLRGVSLEAAPGETLAIVGPTGAGKSTLVSLLPRFYDPWEGAVRIDGQDVREIKLRSLRRQISLVLQEAFLFPISIAENIGYGRPDAPFEEIEAAARAANAHRFIEKLPDGYASIVGERGATLSGGERQRLSIARALLKNAPILILDEPTSALDAATESLLIEALERLMEGRTTFIIAHRLSTIRRAGRIIVLDDGRIAEMGTQAELLARGGLYARLHRLQFGGPADVLDRPAGSG